MDDDRRPRWVYREGEDPDPRFTLANERTLLAWLRTCLGLVAAGAAMVAIGAPPALLVGAGIAALLGAVLAPLALRRWAHTERAMRRGGSLPAPGLLLPLVLGLALLAVLVLLSLVLP